MEITIKDFELSSAQRERTDTLMYLFYKYSILFRPVNGDRSSRKTDEHSPTQVNTHS